MRTTCSPCAIAWKGNLLERRHLLSRSAARRPRIFRHSDGLARFRCGRITNSTCSASYRPRRGGGKVCLVARNAARRRDVIMLVAEQDGDVISRTNARVDEHDYMSLRAARARRTTHGCSRSSRACCRPTPARRRATCARGERASGGGLSTAEQKEATHRLPHLRGISANND